MPLYVGPYVSTRCLYPSPGLFCVYYQLYYDECEAGFKILGFPLELSCVSGSVSLRHTFVDAGASTVNIILDIIVLKLNL